MLPLPCVCVSLLLSNSQFATNGGFSPSRIIFLCLCSHFLLFSFRCLCFFVRFHFYDYCYYSIFSCLLVVLRFHLFAIEIFMRMRCVCASHIHCVLLANNRCVLFIICFRSRLCPFPFCFARDCFSLYIFTIQKGNLMYFYSDISQENHRFTEAFCVFTPISWLSWGIR